jgi:hypothetical protein
MTVNCMAHDLKLSAKALLLRLRLVDELEDLFQTDMENALPVVSDDKDVDVEGEVAETVVKV